MFGEIVLMVAMAKHTTPMPSEHNTHNIDDGHNEQEVDGRDSMAVHRRHTTQYNQ
jgi:hypothetical protein